MASVHFWDTTPTPAIDSDAANLGINLGLAVRPRVAGQITHLRFYEYPDNNANVTLRLLDQSGAVVAGPATYACTPGASGWREVALSSAYAVTVDAYYRVHIRYDSTGGLGGENYGSIPTLRLDTLRSTSGGEVDTVVDGAVTVAGSSGNGTYEYGALTTPTNSFNSGNYAVDLVFATAETAQSASGTVAATSAVTGAAVAVVPATSSVTIASGVAGEAVVVAPAVAVVTSSATVSGSVTVTASPSGVVAALSGTQGAPTTVTSASGVVSATSGVVGAVLPPGEVYPANGQVVAITSVAGVAYLAGEVLRVRVSSGSVSALRATGTATIQPSPTGAVS